MLRSFIGSLCFSALVAGGAQAAIIGVSGPSSSAGTAAAIITAPPTVLDDLVTNTGMQGFNEKQGVLTSIAYATSGGGVIPAGSTINSHMIFLNSAGPGRLSHSNVAWTFDAPVLGVMADFFGRLEAASSAELGAAGTNYTMTLPGQRGAPFRSRGLDGGDSYSVSGDTINVTMAVSEPGDWIRVVTSGSTDEQQPQPPVVLPAPPVVLRRHRPWCCRHRPWCCRHRPWCCRQRRSRCRRRCRCR